jgi:hypothetical protein
MDEKPKSRRGGKRAGAGRKPKNHVPATTIPAHTIRAALASDAPEVVEAEARAHALPMVKVLIDTMLDARASGAARIQACNSILDRGYGKPSVDTGVDMLPFMAKPTTTIPGDVRAECKRYARIAIETLKTIAERGESENARVSAARSILDRGLGTVGAAALADEKKTQTFGKKEAQKIAAEVRVAGGGKFAAPAPPPNARSVQ